MKPKYKHVIALCPESVTGGPEALHQLVDAINKLGGSASIAYTNSTLNVTGEFVESSIPKGSNVDIAYSRYDSGDKKIYVSDECIFLYPEINTKDAYINSIGSQSVAHFKAHKAIWWLSIDNALKLNKNILDQEYVKSVVSKNDVINYCQSSYARRYLESLGLKQLYNLTDYTDESIMAKSTITDELIKIEDRKITSYSRKGKEYSKVFLEQFDNLEQSAFVELQGMTKKEMRDTLFKTKIYIDFGHQPGKDRGPREAAIAGAIVLMRKAGSANFFEDHPIDNYYLFEDDEIYNGNLKIKVEELQSQAELHFKKQNGYRANIKLEKERFYLEVRGAFFM